ncbi:MAG: PEPxxWA-CTERM sorting domain-containing protein, partial [Proteobacteria bacterium]|nr:PEPxxWA-CTERM sorting domain-containing protein [Pseudomonadota bacterium]
TSVRGGWRYFPGSQDSDGSTTQWAVLSMMYDQSLGATTPDIVKSELSNYWLAADQAANGAGCYQPGYLCEQSDTGSLLIGLSFVGKGVGNAQVDNALNFLNNNWTEGANNTWYGNLGQPYAMWADYKALELQIGKGDNSAITNLASSCGAPANLPGNPPGSTACNWWQDYNQWLVDNQNADGSWNGYSYWTGPLATAWNVSILGGIEVPNPGGIPEPTAWALMLIGFGGMGALLRQRRARMALASA